MKPAGAIGRVAFVALAGLLGCLVPIEAHFLQRGFVMLSLGREYLQPFSFSATLPAAACGVAFVIAAWFVWRSAPFYRVGFVATILGVLFLSWRYRLLAAVALVVAVTIQLLSTSKHVGWRQLAIPYWTAFLVALLMPVDISLRQEAGALGFLRVEDALWARKPPDVRLARTSLVWLVTVSTHRVGCGSGNGAA